MNELGFRDWALDLALEADECRAMWGDGVRQLGRLALTAAIAALFVAGCGTLSPRTSPSATIGEQMPAPASVWLTSAAAAPTSALDVSMTSPDDPGIGFAHTFVAGQPVRGVFATSQGRYTLAALGGACSLPLVLGPDEAADVLLTIGPGAGCWLAVAQRGRMGDPAMMKTEDAVLITNHGAGDATPRIEPSPSEAP